jgi:uncharacterized protein
MIYHRFYEAPQDHIDGFITTQFAGRLITVGEDGMPHVGVFPFLHRSGHIEVHLAEGDEQLQDLRRVSSARCVFEIGDVLAFVPSYWEDERNASGADIYHRTVVMEARAELVAEPEDVADHLSHLLARYQPEGGYLDVDAGNQMYAGMLRRLTLIRLSVERTRTKFKLGQQRPEPIRQHIIAELRKRNRHADATAADAVTLTLTAADQPSGR